MTAPKQATSKPRQPAPLAFKPDLEEAARRWEAFYAGEIIDRPIVAVTAPKVKGQEIRRSTYYERVHSDLDAVLDIDIAAAEATYYGGEAVPTLQLTFGPDEIAVFTGAELRWSQDSLETNWSVPYVQDWEKALPLRIRQDNPFWQRMLAFFRRASERTAGKMLLGTLDLHSNMDLLAAIRGPQRLCLDVIEQSEMIDRAMADSRAIFPQLWEVLRTLGRMDERGYCHAFYSMEGAAILQCDYSCMISPAMFRRWVLPALEEEAEIVGHAMYHWDGPGALVHTADLLASRGLHTLSYVPGAGRGSHLDHLELLKRVQAGGKAVQAPGTPEEVKAMHRELRPEKVCYFTRTESRDEAEALLDWFVEHT